MKVSYELKRFKSSHDNDIMKALIMYSQNIEPLFRTDSREIIYWLDNYNRIFEDKLYLFGLYLNDEIIGFAELLHFTKEKIIAVDYIVIEPTNRKNNTFYEFVEQIKNFLIEKDIQFDFVIAEVGSFNEKMEPTDNTKSLIRLLKMAGFGVLKTTYYQPRLGITNFESERSAILMIYTCNDLRKIRKLTFQQCIKTLYFKHYKRWYDKFMNEEQQVEYAASLNKLILDIDEKLKKKDFVEINGYSASYASSLNPLPVKTHWKVAKIIAVIILFILFSCLLGMVHLFMKNTIGIDTEAQSYIVIASVIAVFFIVSVFYEGKTNSIAFIIERMINKFTG